LISGFNRQRRLNVKNPGQSLNWPGFSYISTFERLKELQPFGPPSA